MTAGNGSEDKKTVPGAKEQRPHATLDLTAEDVSSSGKPEQKASEASGVSEKNKTASQMKENPRIAPSSGEGPILPDTDFGIKDFATHSMAGALGGIIALILGYFIYSGNENPALSPKDIQTLRSEITATDQRITSLQQALDGAITKTSQLESISSETTGLNETMAALTDRIAAIESRPGIAGVTEQTVQQSLDPLTLRLAKIEENIDRLTKAQSEIKGNNKGAALALALYNLRRAANEGKPFATELQTIAEMSPVPLDLTGLEKHRDSGVASPEQLASGFDKAANAALDAENKPSDGSLTSELWSKAKSFVRVRRKGDVPGNTTGAILARIEHRLQTGDLRAALSQTAQLEGPAAEAMAAWRAKLEAKVAAEEALSDIEAKLLSALGSEDLAKRGG